MARLIHKHLKKNDLNDAPNITITEVKEAIKKSKASKALGPDKISTLHLKHLGENGLKYLSKLFNSSLQQCSIPDIWKTSKIIPLLKPKKDPKEAKSYRPVSLLCPAIKIMERTLLPYLDEHLTIPDHQHGFRKFHSTTTALHRINQTISNGFNKPQPPDRTLLLQIDLSKAFDMVSHNQLLRDINNSTLPSSLKRWLCCYLLGRQSKVNFRNQTSRARNVRFGVPQGAVTSPILFNFYLYHLPRPPEGSNIQIVQYADDISIFITGRNLKEMELAITEYGKKIIEFLDSKELLVSPEKSTVTLFSPDPREYNYSPEVKLNDVIVPVEKNSKVLGLVLDPKYRFGQHIDTIVKTGKTKLNALKALAGTDWGQDKESITIMYKSTMRSNLEYSIPIFGPIIAQNHWNRLQTLQNHALRTATGCTKMTSVDHLHQETNVLPLKQHAELLTKQYLASFHHPNHPGNADLHRPEDLTSRNKKQTVLKYKQEVQEVFDQPNPPTAIDKKIKKCNKVLHTKAVSQAINSYAPNRVLGTKPPKIHQEENQLSRKTRVKLAQHRSGFVPDLFSYKHRIDESIPDNCPNCNLTPHDVIHLFNCPMKPTELKPIDLWNKPKKTALFLDLDTPPPAT